MRIYNYISKFTGRQYEIKNTAKGWMLSEWSHGGLMFASSKSECVERMNNYYDRLSMDGHGTLCGDDGYTALPVLSSEA